jgi:hypothetical protein
MLKRVKGETPKRHDSQAPEKVTISFQFVGLEADAFYFAWMDGAPIMMAEVGDRSYGRIEGPTGKVGRSLADHK